MRGTIRCKWYDDEGKIIVGSGCRNRSTCTYIHPEEAGWPDAARRLFARPEPNGPRQGPYKSKEKRRDFDESSWKSPQLRQTQTNSGWSVASDNPKHKDSVASSSDSWRGDLGGSASTSTGWGTASGSGAEPDSNGGWGTGGSRGGGGGWGTGSGGWGTGGGGWGTGSGGSGAGDNGWGTTSGGSGAGDGGWGAWGADKGKNKEGGDDANGWDAKAIPETAWGSRSHERPSVALPPRKSSFNAPQRSPNMAIDPRPRPPPQTTLDAGATLGSTAVEAKAKGKERATQKPLNVAISEQTTARLAGVAPAPRASLPTTTQPQPSPTIPMGPPPVPHAKPVPPPPPINLATVNNDKDTLLAQAGALKRKSSGGQLKVDPKKSILKLSPQDRIDKYRSVIEHIFLLVYIQFCLKKAKATEENWRRNNNSEHYAKSTQGTRKKLESGRKEAAECSQDLRRQRAENIVKLLSLPDIPSRSHRPYDPDRDREKIKKYTLELRNWITELDLPKRLAAYRQLPSNRSETAKDNAAGPSSQKEVIPSVVDQLDTRVGVSFEDLKAAADALEARVISVEENIYMSAYTVSDIDDAMEEFREGFMKKRNAARLKKLSAEVTTQIQDSAQVDAALRQSLDEATAVDEKIQSLKAALEDLKAKTESLKKSNEEAERMIQEAENKQEERSNLVKELSEQLATLRLTRKSPRPVREVTIDDIAPEIQQEIVDQVKAQLKPVMEGIIAGTRHAGEALKEEVDKIVSQVIDKTAELTATAESVVAESAS